MPMVESRNITPEKNEACLLNLVTVNKLISFWRVLTCSHIFVCMTMTQDEFDVCDCGT